MLIGVSLLIISKYSYRLLDKLEWLPTGQYVIFNRRTGMIEIANDERSNYHYLPFEEFNAHHRKVHSERGGQYYGFTLLHYKEDLMYQVADYSSVESAITHWELIKNFMDTTQPLADIPQFEKYRAFDPSTLAYDKKNVRPENFWHRVDKKFMKKISKIATEAKYTFPTKHADTLKEAERHGYEVPDAINFPWKEAVNLPKGMVLVKPNFLYRYLVLPFLF